MSLRTYFKCLGCGDVHEDEDDALECCRPSIVEVFRCPLCCAVFDDEAEAYDCCDTDDEFFYRPTVAELEAHGQLRLLP